MKVFPATPRSFLGTAWLLPVCLGLAAPGAARAQELAAGRTTEQVVTRADPGQSYAVYLPTTFNPAAEWPVIFVFDPGARGGSAVERLRPAAERFGYIVAGSNNSRNGPLQPQHAAMVAMIGDLSQRVPLDPRRIYTAGMSGGSRIALMTALLSGKLRGVLAFSAAQPVGMSLPARVPFAVFGTVGKTDMNYAEMRQFDLELEDKGATHRLAVFEGGHTWPPAGLVMEGVEWLELEAMRGGVRSRDDALIRNALQARVAAIPKAPAPERWLAVQSVARDFQGLADVAAFEREARELGASREVKAWQAATRKAAEREMDLHLDFEQAARDGDAPAMKGHAARVRRLLDGPNPEDRAMARRIANSYASSMRSMVRSAMQEESYEVAAAILEALVALDPNDSRSRFDLARARGYQGDRRGAIAALTAAVKAGYANAAQAGADPAFAGFRSDAAFQALLAKMAQPAGADAVPR